MNNFHQDRSLQFDQRQQTREKRKRGSEREHERQKGQVYSFYIV